MPYYKQISENIGSAGGSQIRVLYNVDKGNTETGTFPIGTSVQPLGSVSGMLRGIPGTSFRQKEKLPVDFSIDPCNDTKFNVTGYSTPRDRIVYIGEDLNESLNSNYTGCCFDENGNQVPEPSLNQKRVMDITLEGIGFDIYGKPVWESQPTDFYFISCGVSEGIANIIRSETFTVTFDGMTPQISGTAPYLDDDITVTLERSDGQSVTATSSTSTVSMTATYPQTIKIKVRGKFSKKLFPNDTWEYYFEKYDAETREPKNYTPIPGHLKITVPTEFPRAFDETQEVVVDPMTAAQYETNITESTLIKQYPQDPNEFVDAYRIDQNNKNGTGLVLDLSQEVPVSNGGILLRYIQDQEDDIDVKFSFSVTSSIPPLTVIPWAFLTTLSAGDYVSFGGTVWYVEVGGVVDAGTPGDPLADPPTEGTPADTGPSGTGFFTDNSGITYRYMPPLSNYTTYGAGTLETTMYIMNDQKIGAARFEELLNQQQKRRIK